MTVLAHYTLRRKDIPLVHFRLEAEQEVTAGMAQTIYQVHVTQVEEGNRHLLPGMLREQLTDASLLTWIDRRKAPKNRQFVDQIMHAIADDENPLRYVDISHALSLNDAFWITNDDVLLYGRTSTSIRIRLTRCWPMSPSRDTVNAYPASYRLRS